MKTYVVKPGDTLTGICLKQGLCKLGAGKGRWNGCLEAARQVANWSGIADFNVILPGQVLFLDPPPAAVEHIQPGGTRLPWYLNPAVWMMAVGAGLVLFNKKGRK